VAAKVLFVSCWGGSPGLVGPCRAVGFCRSAIAGIGDICGELGVFRLFFEAVFFFVVVVDVPVFAYNCLSGQSVVPDACEGYTGAPAYGVCLWVIGVRLLRAVVGDKLARRWCHHVPSKVV